MQHFREYSNPLKANKVLLLVDGHASHKTLDVTRFAKENGIEMICFPPHCTHRLQPLDVCFFRPLKTFYDQDVTKWLKCHPGRTVSSYQIGGLFAAAYGKAATNQNAVSGLIKTGKWPLNPDIFPDYLFNPAMVTDRYQDSDTQVANHSLNINNISVIRPQDISPLPSSSGIQANPRKRKAEGTKVLTSTPILEELKAREAEKQAAEFRKAAKRTKKNLTHLVESPLSLKEVIQIKEVAKESKNRITRKAAIVASEHFVPMDESSDNEEPFQDEDDEDDLYCNSLYSMSKSKEPWVRSCSK
ncbi:uncharacterized protein LOC126733931 [Anthonomus grandis grandis]|uniref:uncharacterized protein LOC126733931 n=1 Tax=Anthonomus grandis grandis TaxID=2921223 RepID=UPI00216593F6|nr:uncharacterized protein LOC126733931 [Anthonomus grandis grandis]